MGPNLKYGVKPQIWGQTSNTYIDKIFLIQKNAAHTNPIFKKLKILKLKDHKSLQNCLSAYNFINKKLPRSFNNTIDAWNHFNKQLKDKNLSNLPRYKLKKLITEQIPLTYI